jgi:exopolysaccharide biosynthesis protein
MRAFSPLGDSVKMLFVIEKEWLDVYQSLTGGPMLIQQGRIVLDGISEEKFRRGFYERIPVTAVGTDGYKNLLLLVADGRQRGYSVGMTYYETAQFMRDYLGAWDAIALDGGGSSAMTIAGQTVNRPSDGAQRAVSNGIVVLAGH